MPIYEYSCPNGHKTDVLCKFEQRALSAHCVCGESATLSVSLPARGIVTGSKTPLRGTAARPSGFTEVQPGVYEKGTSIDADKVVAWRCAGSNKTGVAVDEPLPTCCGEVAPYINEESKWKDWFPVGGYFDRGLGVFFNSRKERSDYAAANGLQEASGGYEDTDRAVYESQAGQREQNEFWREECRQAAAAGDRGHVPQWIKDEVKWVD